VVETARRVWVCPAAPHDSSYSSDSRFNQDSKRRGSGSVCLCRGKPNPPPSGGALYESTCAGKHLHEIYLKSLRMLAAWAWRTSEYTTTRLRPQNAGLHSWTTLSGFSPYTITIQTTAGNTHATCTPPRTCRSPHFALSKKYRLPPATAESKAIHKLFAHTKRTPPSKRERCTQVTKPT